MNFDFSIDEELFSLIVAAAVKGVGEDIRIYKETRRKECCNSARFISTENIYNNLCKSPLPDCVNLVCFSRSGWDTFVVINHNTKRTYSICSQKTLKRIRKKKKFKSIPHYLDTLLHNENGNIRAQYEQLVIGECVPEFEDCFTKEEYEKDFDRILHGVISPNSGYTHVIISYNVKNLSMTSINAKLFTSDFVLADTYSLNRHINPDFSQITAHDEKSVEFDSHSLVSVKPNLTTVKPVIVKPKEREGAELA